MTVRAVWNGTVIAESENTVVVVEGNHYFPEEALRREFFTPIWPDIEIVDDIKVSR